MTLSRLSDSRLRAGALPEKLLRYLDSRRAWVSLTHIQGGFLERPEAVARALYRLRERGLVESRVANGWAEWRAFGG